MPAPSSRQSLATTEQILGAATRLFAAQGFGATSLQDVADAVGIRKQSLLYHFPSKDDLRQRVLDALLSRWNDVLPRLLLAATSGEGQFDAVVAETVGFFSEDPDRARLLLREILDRPGDVRVIIGSQVARWVNVVSGYIRKGISRGTCPPDVNPDAYVLAVINLILSCIATADCFEAVAPRDRLTAELQRIAKSSLFHPEKVSPPMANYFKDNEDLRFYLDKAIDWSDLTALVERGYRDPGGHEGMSEAVSFYREVLEMIGEVCADEVAPHAAAIDRNHPRLEGGEAVIAPELARILRKLSDLDLHALTLPRELSGMNCPLLIYMLSVELLARADVSVMAQHGFFGGIATMMLQMSQLEGTTDFDPVTGTVRSTRFQREIAEIATGRAWGCMDITEPDAGSDMAALRTVGEQDASGQWTVSGQKIFVTVGHGKYHFVIARTEPGDTGLSGLSMFLAETYREEGGRRVRLASIDRIEEKLGHHGSVTAAVTFNRTPAVLIGKRGEGFKWMLQLMNGARVSVGFESIGLCEAAYRAAREYAAGRPSMGKTIDRHEMIADYLDEMATDIQGLRALAIYCGLEVELGHRKELAARFAASEEADRLRQEARAHHRRARRATPLLKYLGAEKAVEISRRALQIHGGNGYMVDYGVERLVRDAMVLPIYEGTSQIQALMAMKDTLGAAIKNPQGFIKRVAQTRWRAVSSRDDLERRVARIQAMSLSAQQHLLTRTAADKVRSLSGRPLTEWPRALRQNWNPKRDFAFAMLHAERLCRLMADEMVCEVLLAQAKAHPERRDLLERTLERAEPRCRRLLDEITTTGARLLAELAARDDVATAADVTAADESPAIRAAG